MKTDTHFCSMKRQKPETDVLPSDKRRPRAQNISTFDICLASRFVQGWCLPGESERISERLFWTERKPKVLKDLQKLLRLAGSQKVIGSSPLSSIRTSGQCDFA